MASLCESTALFQTYEQRLFASSVGGPRPLPCTLITGFLGCGKTTLVRHILAHKGSLRVAVLVNEFAQADIDGALLNTAHISASLGVQQATPLSNGCACCDISEAFRAAVQSLVSKREAFDYLVVETSGLADPQPLAHALKEVGVQLERVVALVDAEALPGMLQLDVARKQLAAADLVVINKCDLVSLGSVSDVEDHIEDLTGGTQAVRCRFSQVPLELVLSLDVHVESHIAATVANGDSGFLSHERLQAPVKVQLRQMQENGREFAPVSKASTQPPFHERSSGAGSRDVPLQSFARQSNGNHLKTEGLHLDNAKNPEGARETASKSGAGQGTQAEHASTSSRQDHGVSNFGSASVQLEVPLSLLRFQAWVRDQLMGPSGVLRAKGVAWFAEDRSHRYIFQYSGRQRVDLHTEGRWESPPGTTMVLIGRDKQAVPGLVAQFQACTHTEDASASNTPVPHSPAQQLRGLLAGDAHFKVLDGPSRATKSSDSSPPSAAAEANLVCFVLRGEPLRGVDQSRLTTDLIQKVNGRRSLLLAAVQIHAEGCVAQAVLGPEDDAAAAWALIGEEAKKVRASAYRNIHACRCDITKHA